MASPDLSSANGPRDWELLAQLFAQGGAYRHKMGLRRFPATEFYAPTADGATIRIEKAAILESTSERHLLTTPRGHDAAAEFAQSLGPSFAPDVSAETDGQRAFNRQLGLALEPDLLFVQPPDWTLEWANVCFPSRWSLEGKAGRPLTCIHEAVPGLNADLSDKIATFFARMAPGEGWRRANWGLSGSPLRNQHPDESIPTLEATTGPDQIFVRVEDQHLLKLPVTGAIAFGIRIASYAWPDVMRRSAIAASLLEQFQSMPPDVVRYKDLGRVILSLKE